MQGKTKFMVENRTSDPLDPSPDSDCHMSKAHNVDLQSVTPQEAFESTQVCILLYLIYFGKNIWRNWQKHLFLPRQFKPLMAETCKHWAVLSRNLHLKFFYTLITMAPCASCECFYLCLVCTWHVEARQAREMLVCVFALCCRFTCTSTVTTLTSLTDLVRCIPVPWHGLDVTWQSRRHLGSLLLLDPWGDSARFPVFNDSDKLSLPIYLTLMSFITHSTPQLDL